MTDYPHDPFVFPGMNPEGAGAAGNPLLASMEMMRKAWADLAGPAGLAQSLPMPAPISVEDLDRRIGELRSVENWLRMNLSMLSSTIQGMEVQRATIATLRSFVDNASAQAARGASFGEASPLDVVLGLKPAPARPPASDDGAPAGRGAPNQDGAGLPPTPWFGAERAAARVVAPAEPAAGLGGDAAPTAETPDHAQTATPADAGADARANGDAHANAAASDQHAMAQSMGDAAQAASAAWWNLLQHQFGQLAAATAASMPAYGTAGAEASGAAGTAGMPDGEQPSARAHTHTRPRSGAGGGKSAGQGKAAPAKKPSGRAKPANQAKPLAQTPASSAGTKPAAKAPSSVQLKPAAKAKSSAQGGPAAKRAPATAGRADSQSQPAASQRATGARAARRSPAANKAAPRAAKNARA